MKGKPVVICCWLLIAGDSVIIALVFLV